MAEKTEAKSRKEKVKKEKKRYNGKTKREEKVEVTLCACMYRGGQKKY